MISCVTEPLPAQTEAEFQRWLGNGQFSTLQKVLEGKLREQQVRALTEATQAKEFPNKAILLESALEEAARIQTTLDILRTIITADTHYTVKLT